MCVEMKVAVLFSGGKDSNFALYWALNQGFDVKHLVNILPQREDSFMFHKPCVKYTKLQAKSIGVPLTQKKVSGVKEDEVGELEKILSKLKVDGIVSGAVASEYQKTRIDSVCERLSLRAFAPLWGKNQEQLVGDIINAGFAVMMVGIAAEGLTEKWLGKILTLDDLAELKELKKKYGINFSGEGGEYETFVLNGPMYKKRIVVKKSEKKMSSQNSGALEIKEAVLT